MDGIALSEILRIADDLFPFELAEEWDNCGLQIGDPARIIERVGFSLDATLQTVQFAATASCGLLVTHHPVLLDPIRRITPENHAAAVLLKAAREGVDILSLHTNLDAAPGGLNDLVTSLAGLENVTVPEPARCARIGTLPAPLKLSDFAREVRETFQLDHIRVVGAGNTEIQRVFCACGSGMGYLREATHQNAEVMLTGDVRYHAAREALETGMNVIDAGHFGLEKFAVSLLAEKFGEEFSRLGRRIECVECRLETDPFATPYQSPRRASN